MWWFEGKAPGIRKTVNVILLLSLPAIVSGCGFQPMYGQTANHQNVSQLDRIAVESQDDEIGSLMKREMLAELSTVGKQPANPIYVLRMQPNWVDTEVAIQQDTEVTRRNVQVQARFQLIDPAQENRVLYSGQSVSQSSYNRVTSEYANISSARAATSRTVKAVAEDVRMKVAAFLATQNRPAP